MKFFVMFVIGFLFDKLEITKHALESLSKMDDLNVSIKMMLVSKTHYTMLTFVIFYVRMRNHMPL